MAQLVITVNDAVVQQHLAAFIRRLPIPDSDGDGTPDYTAAQWAKLCVIDFLRSTIEEGYRIIRDSDYPPNSVGGGDIS